MYNVLTSNGYKVVGNIDISKDRLITASGEVAIGAIHPVSTDVILVKAGGKFTTFPGFALLRKTTAGNIRAGKLLKGIGFYRYGTLVTIDSVATVHSNRRVEQISTRAAYFISGVEVENVTH